MGVLRMLLRGLIIVIDSSYTIISQGNHFERVVEVVNPEKIGFAPISSSFLDINVTGS